MAEVFRWVPNGVARMAGNDPIMDQTARAILFIVKKRARQHMLTGDYMAHLKARNIPGKKGVRDRGVFAEDKAAYSIEWGHFAPRKGAPGARFVVGQHIMGGAVAELPGQMPQSHMRYG